MTTDSDLLFRLTRLQRAMRATRSPDLSTLRAHVVSGPNSVSFTQDFRSGATDEDLSNWLHQVIGLVTHMQDVFEQWATQYGKGTEKVRHFFASSAALNRFRLIYNRDKHPKPKDKEHRPYLAHFHRGLELTPKGGEATAAIVLESSPHTQTISLRSTGENTLVTDADILDCDGNEIGKAQADIRRAISEIEDLCRDLGISVGN